MINLSAITMKSLSTAKMAIMLLTGGDDCDEEVVSEDDKDAEGADSLDDKEEDVSH